MKIRLLERFAPFNVEPGDLPNVDINYGLGGAFLNTRHSRSGRKEKKRWLAWLRR